MKQAPIFIQDYAPQWKADFVSLNIAWIQKFFVVEEHDKEQLEHVEEIVNRGGVILFATQSNVPVGTVALIKENDKLFELAKMAVDEAHQGKGIGRLLIEHCIKKAKQMGVEKLFLLSNKKLVPAISLYTKMGFVEKPLIANDYDRADIYMELDLTKNE